MTSLSNSRPQGDLHRERTLLAHLGCNQMDIETALGIDEIKVLDKLIDALQALREQLQNAGNRIQDDIAQYTELSQQTTRLTEIISDSVKKLPDRMPQ
jgi:hypothetical protein